MSYSSRGQVRMAECHPDRPYAAKGMCWACYDRTPERVAKRQERDRRRYAESESRRADQREAVLRWREANPERWREHMRKGSKRWSEDNPDQRRQVKRENQLRLRREMIAAYGGGCSCCGESEHHFLALEHVHGYGHFDWETRNANGKRKGNDSVLRRLKRDGWPQDGYTVLCHNCNMGKHLNGGVCPHDAAMLELLNTPARHGIETPAGLDLQGIETPC